MEVLSLKNRKNPAGFRKNFRWLKTYLQRSATFLTHFGVMMLCSGIVILRHKLSMMTGVALLPSLWTTRWRLLLFGLYPGRIRGWRLRRIGRILSQSTLKNPDLIFESPILNFKFRYTLDKGDEKILNGWMKRCQCFRWKRLQQIFVVPGLFLHREIFQQKSEKSCKVSKYS
ncbi:MAG: hypothetical protein RDV48_29600 [Candidatus Eremiobacteraeota bacterium]|nr:hypothetical protein [Candidatus Eremiobacteraeota bacterium]